MEKNSKTIQNKLTTVKYDCSKESHLVVDKRVCNRCKEKTCTFICPADVYSTDKATGDIVVQYENCFECGACRIACPKKNIKWSYPSSGCGVVLKNS